MRLLISESTDVYRNLAAEEYLLKYSSEDIFMLWQSDNAVVVGKNQNVAAEVDIDYATRNDIRIARRYSGGGAVYQDMGNLNLTFIESTDKIDFNLYIDRVITFLASIGIKAEADERLGITVNGLKVSGSAQCIHKNRVMYHCTLLYSTDLEVLDISLNGDSNSSLLAGTTQVRAVKSVRSQVTNLNNYVQKSVSIEEFKQLIRHYFSGVKESAFTPEELLAIEHLRNEKYIQDSWIYFRSLTHSTASL